ncbi:MAG: DNA repair protein RecN [Clostridia bacterium]|nr:DNA repair protein RecN [Clostridia bacterium]
MLNTLVINNIALIDKLEVSFAKGLNILSGETGAGKSIIIDSVNFVLGRRVDKSIIRYGEDRAQVSAYFDYDDKIASSLADMGIEVEDDEIMLSRIMSTDGKNVCRINGQKVTVAMLREVAQQLADIYGQHESSKLLDSDTHLSVLDSYAQDKLRPYLSEQKALYDEYREVRSKIAKYGDMHDIDRVKDLLAYQINEIQEAQLQPGEEEKLLLRRKKINNYEVLLTALSGASNALDGDGGALEGVGASFRELVKCAEYDERISQLCDRIDSCKIELSDICDEINGIADDCEFDPSEAQYVYDRLDKIRTLERKYGADIDAVIAAYNQFKEQYEFYEGGEQALDKLNSQLKQITAKLDKNTAKITTVRKECAKVLENLVTAQLRHLGMKNAIFQVHFADKEDIDGEVNKYSPIGSDVIEFLFSANSGQPVKPLSKIISGGELSRFMLAIKNTIADTDAIQTMIFDEIDTGISGETAQIVAEKLYDISRSRQVLAVTHLPQLASMADSHYLIAKSVKDGKTYTSLDMLDSDGMLREIARLIGGRDYSDYALPHAKEMKEHSDLYKVSH